MRAMSHFPEGTKILTMCIDELYGIELIDDEELELESESESESVEAVVAKRYEDKYVESYAKMLVVALTPEYTEGLMNNFVMESTPSGNVMMRYNSEKLSFEYYSDNIIPNRYLDVVARKFVCAYNCAVLYEAAKSETVVVSNTNTNTNTNKSVFVKLKTYNQPKKRCLTAKEVISSNRYTSCGKMANMEMLKKVDRKIVDRTYGMSFSEYKQLNK